MSEEGEKQSQSLAEENQMTLTSYRRKQLKKALIDAFRTKPELRQFLKDELNENLDEIALGENLVELISKLIENAESRGWESELIFAARESNPGNPKLSAFVQEYEALYCEQLALDAKNAIVEVQAQVAEVIESQPNANYTELMQKLQEILDKLNEPETLAAGRVKLAFNLVPGLLTYEAELGAESPLINAFQSIRRLFEEVKAKK